MNWHKPQNYSNFIDLDDFLYLFLKMCLLRQEKSFKFIVAYNTVDMEKVI